MAGTKSATLLPLFVDQRSSYPAAREEGVAKQFAAIESGTPLLVAAWRFLNMLGQHDTMTENGLARVLLKLFGEICGLAVN